MDGGPKEFGQNPPHPPPPTPNQISVKVRLSQGRLQYFWKLNKEEEIHENERHHTTGLQPIYELFDPKVIIAAVTALPGGGGGGGGERLTFWVK